MKLFTAIESQDATNIVPITTKSSENEITVYADIGDKTGLDQALSKTTQTDYVAKFEKEGCKARVRIIETPDSKRIEYTIKIKNPDQGNGAVASCTEYTVEVDELFLEGFKVIAEKPVTKDRYVFETKEVTISIGEEGETKTIPVEGVIYEIDVMVNNTNQCKIDIEVDKIIDAVTDASNADTKINILAKVSHLPFKPTGVFSSFNGGQEKVDAFWSKGRGEDSEVKEPVEESTNETEVA